MKSPAHQDRDALVAADFLQVPSGAPTDFPTLRGYARGEPPAPLDDPGLWETAARTQTEAFALIYGQVHREPRMEALTTLVRLLHAPEDAWSLAETMGAWEELNWRWWDELRHELGGLLKDLQATRVTLPELSAYASAPKGKGGARLRLPLSLIHI